MPNSEYATEVDGGFIGFDSRTNPALLKPQMLQYAENVRIERGEAQKRKGLERLDDASLVDEGGDPLTIYSSIQYVTPEGVEKIALATADRLVVFTPSIEPSLYEVYNYPTGRTISNGDSCHMVQAIDKLFIFRGLPEAKKTCVVNNQPSPHTTVTVTCTNHGYAVGNEIIISDVDPDSPIEDFFTTSAIVASVTNANVFTYTIPTPSSHHNDRDAIVQRGKPALEWNGSNVAVVPQGSSIGLDANMPPTDLAMYYGNRIVVKVDRNSIALSDFLDFTRYDLTFGQFTINQGANDRIVGFTTWADDEFLVFQRNSIYIGRAINTNYDIGEGVADTSYLKTVTSSFGCVARKGIINTGRFVAFLSDSGIFLLEPQFDLRLINTIEPISSPIENITREIREDLVKDAVGVYFNNRIYMAVPIGSEATGNNRVLIYNVINKAWESIDRYYDNASAPALNIKDFVVCIRGDKKRLFAITSDGIFLMEEREDGDENIEFGIPRLPVQLRELQPWVEYPDDYDESDFPIQQPDTVYPADTVFGFMRDGQKYVYGFFLKDNVASYYQVNGYIVTRKMTFGTAQEKRFSTLQVDADFIGYGVMRTEVKVYNPDQDAVVDEVVVPASDDILRKVSVARKGYAIEAKIYSPSGRPVIRAISVDATRNSRRSISKD
jgi:hypothetical protein